MSTTIPTPLPGITLRFAGEADVGLVLGLIRELAEYEKLLDQVVADEAVLGRHLFGEPRTAEVVLVCEHDEPVGFALFFHNFSTFLGRRGLYLEDLYVRPAYRGRGLGKLLLGFLARLALERDCGRIDWWVLDWNTPAIGFYRRLGAVAMDEWTVYRLAGEALAGLARSAPPV